MIDKLKQVKIIEVIKETPSIKSFLFNIDIKGFAGQFVMVWIPCLGEKPFSISYSKPFGITIKKVGPFTSELFNFREGDNVWIRGPYGSNFPINDLKNSHVCIIVGGIGAAPLGLLAEQLGKNNRVTTYIGAKTADEILFEDRFLKFGKTVIATDDGSRGYRGFITDLLLKINIKKNNNYALCGNEQMLVSAVNILRNKIPHKQIYLCLERYIKCGVGACGYCCIDSHRICTDGPVMTYDKIQNSNEFGRIKRDHTGSIVLIKR